MKTVECWAIKVIYGAPKFTTVYLLKWPVLGLPQAPDDSFFPPSVLVFQKLINVAPAFIPDYRVNLLYILDSNLPAKKLLLGNQYSTFIEHITKNIHTWSCKALWGTGLSHYHFLKNTMLFSLSLWCPKVYYCLFIKMTPVLGLPQAPDNSFFPPSVLVFQKLINVGPAFIPDYRVNLLYILDSNLPAKKLLLGNQYSTFIEHITKNIHTWSCKALWGPGLSHCHFLRNTIYVIFFILV